MDARPDVGGREAAVAQLDIDVLQARLADVEETQAQRGAYPFVQVGADEIGAEVRNAEIELAPFGTTTRFSSS